MASEAPSMNFKSGQRISIQVSTASAAAMEFSGLDIWRWHAACFQHGMLLKWPSAKKSLPKLFKFEIFEVITVWSFYTFVLG
jgi:hypothetical protein